MADQIPAEAPGDPTPLGGPKPSPHGGLHPDPFDDLHAAQELLDRTVDFLAHCMEDPDAAMASQDPRELIDGLRDLARTHDFQVRRPHIRRRSA